MKDKKTYPNKKRKKKKSYGVRKLYFTRTWDAIKRKQLGKA